MRGSRYAGLALAGILALSGPAGAAEKPAPAKAQASAQAARAKALVSFQRDLVSVLSPSASAQSLLGAALLARPLPRQPAVNSYPRLIERAAKAEGAGPEVTWAQLAECDAKAGDCPNAAALDKLAAQAADNAAVWLLKLGQDSHDGKQDAARADLAKAAAAKLYDDYTGASLKALASAVTVLPPPPATLDPASAAGPAGVQVVILFGVAGTLPQPGLQDTAKLCDPGAAADVKSDCLKLGKTLEWGSSPLARSLGLHLRETLDADPARQEDARHARRDLIWQVQNYARLAARAQGDKALAQHLLALARNGGTEMSMLLATLRDYGISTTAPADWSPQQKPAG
jgi:hypothetical protein